MPESLDQRITRYKRALDRLEALDPESDEFDSMEYQTILTEYVALCKERDENKED